MMRGRPHPFPPAFSLVEVTLALGVAGFCLVAILGLLPIGVNSNQTSIEQTVSAGIISSFAADLRSTPRTAPPSAQKSPRFQLQVPASGTTTQAVFLKEDGTLAGAIGADANPAASPRYRATITLTAPSALTQKSATVARILITWPALADPTASAAPAKFAGSMESMTALDRIY